MSEFPGINVFDLLISERMATSQNGRPLAELEAPIEKIAEVRKAGIEVDRVVCPYPGSRYGKLMNRAAFIALSSHKDELLDNLAWINLNYFAVAATPQRPYLQQATELVGICTALPSYCFFRTEQPYGLVGELPDVIADIAKAAKGLTKVVSGRTILPQYMPTPNATSLYQYAEEEYFLLNDAGACPATETVIKETIDALFFRSGGDPGQALLATVIKDFPNLKAYAVLYADANAATRAYARKQLERGYDQLEEKLYLIDMKEYQMYINDVLGRGYNPQPPSAADMLRFLTSKT